MATKSRRIRKPAASSTRADRTALLTRLGEETYALFGRGTLPVPTALRETYGALVALEKGP